MGTTTPDLPCSGITRPTIRVLAVALVVWAPLQQPTLPAEEQSQTALLCLQRLCNLHEPWDPGNSKPCANWLWPVACMRSGAWSVLLLQVQGKLETTSCGTGYIRQVPVGHLCTSVARYTDLDTVP
jgi:hypothetical protein